MAIASALILKTTRERWWALAPVTASTLVWIVAHQLAYATEPLPPPEMTLAQLDGPPLTLSAPADKPSVINIWATWCPPCRREMPALAQAEQSHPNVRFLYVNQGEAETTVRSYLDRESLSLTHVLLDPIMALPRHYRTSGIPVTLFLYADGRLAKAHLGEIAPERIAAEIARLK
ncbi:TlpA family protein disulfide reductase [Brevundimonas nasdae]|uniref:TlpA family protein disulfide reductase n=1 Tax=Brevundimonas nasdae TaxID=172043 RepID=UPI001FD06606|nr:TlpA disulfide reductase family protein [Brevundimonas nasdae]